MRRRELSHIRRNCFCRGDIVLHGPFPGADVRGNEPQVEVWGPYINDFDRLQQAFLSLTKPPTIPPPLSRALEAGIERDLAGFLARFVLAGRVRITRLGKGHRRRTSSSGDISHLVYDGSRAEHHVWVHAGTAKACSVCRRAARDTMPLT